MEAAGPARDVTRPLAPLAVIVAVAGLLAAALAFALTGVDSPAVVVGWLDRLRALGDAGALIFVGLQALVALIGFVPASLLGLAAGAVYGLIGGFALSAMGLLIGAAVAFGLARSALRGPVVALVARRGGSQRLDAALVQDGWRLVLLLRASPVMPFSLTSFALGLSGIGFRDYAIGTLASLPALGLYVGLGSLGRAGLGAAGDGGHWARVGVLALGLVATGLLSLRIGRLVVGTAVAHRAIHGEKHEG